MLLEAFLSMRSGGLKQLAQTAIAHMVGEGRQEGALARATFVELERLGDGEAMTIGDPFAAPKHGIRWMFEPC